MILFSIICYSVLLLSTVVAGSSESIVRISLGQIRGSLMFSSSGRQFSAFRGIPYAKPPVKELRFNDPVPIDPWTDILDATRDGPTCFQFDPFTGGFKGTEDCLAVNIYTHSVSPDSGLRPVMVWIHGGGWSLGSGSGETDQFGPEFFMDRDIVLVTINYRLGPLGFLSTHDEVAPGNYGLLDQSLALKWIQDHIRHFGGDPDSVTIFGASAGGGAVHHHVLSPYSKGLFHRAIVQSGSSLCAWATLEHVDKYSKLLAENAQCSTASSQEMIDCLRWKSPEEIIAYVIKFIMEVGIPVIVFGPRVDSERLVPFFPEHPRELLKSGQFSRVPLIIGMDKNEGLAMLLVTGLPQGNKDRINLFEENPAKFMVPILAVQDQPNAMEICERALNKYMDENVPVEQQLSQLEMMIADYGFFHCMDEAVQYHSQYNPTYYYMYTHRGQVSSSALYGVPPTIDLGVAHTDELFLMFKHHIAPPPMTEEDKRVSKTLIDLWTSFAKTGEPSSDAVPDWPIVSKEQNQYLNIKLEPEVVIDQMPFHNRLDFWNPVVFPARAREEL